MFGEGESSKAVKYFDTDNAIKVNMEENKILMVKSLLFNNEKEEILAIIPKIDDQETLYVYIYIIITGMMDLKFHN